MAHFVFTNAYLTVNAVTLSDHVESLEWTLNQDIPEDTSMGATARTYLGGGLKDSDVTVTFRNDFAASEVWATISAIYTAGTAVAIAARPVNTTISATNPELQANAILNNFNPLAGTTGDTANMQVGFKCTGPVTFDTTP